MKGETDTLKDLEDKMIAKLKRLEDKLLNSESDNKFLKVENQRLETKMKASETEINKLRLERLDNKIKPNLKIKGT